MGKSDYLDFQTRTEPLAYLITFRCYGSWLHGETRGSVARRNYNRYGTPDMGPNKKILTDEKGKLMTAPVVLNQNQRRLVESAIREVCEYRSYFLYAASVRTNHVHVVVAAPCKPEHIMDSFKSYATRNLHERKFIGDDVKPWARHGSTCYLWTEEEMERAVDYGINGQGNEPFR